MRKDITIPLVEHVYVVAIQEWNDDFQENSWYAYLLNNNEKPLEMAMVVSSAHGIINKEERKTGTFRHAFKVVPAKTAVKIELLENNVLQLNNDFLVTYFIDQQLFDKKFVFEAHSITIKNAKQLPAIGKEGVIAE